MGPDYHSACRSSGASAATVPRWRRQPLWKTSSRSDDDIGDNERLYRHISQQNQKSRFHPHAKLSPAAPPPLGRARIMSKVNRSSQAGGTQVGVTLRLNTLAVCAVFLFLGAII